MQLKAAFRSAVRLKQPERGRPKWNWEQAGERWEESSFRKGAMTNWSYSAKGDVQTRAKPCSLFASQKAKLIPDECKRAVAQTTLDKLTFQIMITVLDSQVTQVQLQAMIGAAIFAVRSE